VDENGRNSFGYLDVEITFNALALSAEVPRRLGARHRIAFAEGCPDGFFARCY
jgi:hypothetical protein